MSVKAKVLVITGPTASGKSVLAEGLASRFPLELTLPPGMGSGGTNVRLSNHLCLSQ